MAAFQTWNAEPNTCATGDCSKLVQLLVVKRHSPLELVFFVLYCFPPQLLYESHLCNNYGVVKGLVRRLLDGTCTVDTQTAIGHCVKTSMVRGSHSK